MSIQTTQLIKRIDAINRIKFVYQCVIEKKYRTLEMNSFEPEKDVECFVDYFYSFDISNIEEWTNNMLTNKMDSPFFRNSMFDNYIVQD